MTTTSLAEPITVILLVIIAGIPLAMAPYLFLGYVTIPKLVIALIGSACLLILPGLWGPGTQALRKTTYGRIYLFLLCAQLVSLGVSTLHSGDWQLSLFGTTSRRLGAISLTAIVVVTAIAASYAGCRPRFARQSLSAIEITGGIVAAYGILQYLGFDPFLPPQSYESRLTGDVARIPGTFGHVEGDGSHTKQAFLRNHQSEGH